MTEADLSITRVFEAPREEVWKEWTEPERFADWYGGTHAEVPVDSVSMDVRPGGSWRATMYAGPDRREIQWKGQYREVEAPERLVLTVTDQPEHDETDLAIVDLVTVVLTDLGDGRTEMRMEQSGGHMPPEQYERAKQGWGTFFDRMEARLSDA